MGAMTRAEDTIETEGTSTMPDKKQSAAKPSADKTAEAHTELRRHDADGAGSGQSAGASEKAPALKPRAPDDKVPGGEDGTDDLFNDVPV
jgi:hypothetical protein